MSQDAVRTVFCVKLQKELPGLKEIPFDGHPLGQRVFDNVSQDAWKQWVEHMKMLMNEYRIDLSDKSARQLLKQQCEQFFFGDGSAPPPDFVPHKH